MKGNGYIRFCISLLIIATLLMFLIGCTVSVGDQGVAVNAGATATAAGVLPKDNMIQTAVAATLTQAAALTPTPKPATPTPEPATPGPPTPEPTHVTPIVTVKIPTVHPKITPPLITLVVPTPKPIVTVVVTVLPIGTPIVTLPPAVHVCDPPPATSFKAILDANQALANEVGCPISNHPQVTPDAWEVQTAYEQFEHGAMIWSNKIGWYDQPVIYVVSENGSYQRYNDTFDENVDPESGGEAPPPGLFEPIRGFGKVWRDNPGVRSALGWALEHERGGPGRFQLLEGGDMIWLSETDHTYVFVHSNSTWSEFNVTFQP